MDLLCAAGGNLQDILREEEAKAAARAAAQPPPDVKASAAGAGRPAGWGRSAAVSPASRGAHQLPSSISCSIIALKPSQQHTLFPEGACSYFQAFTAAALFASLHSSIPCVKSRTSLHASIAFSVTLLQHLLPEEVHNTACKH